MIVYWTYHDPFVIGDEKSLFCDALWAYHNSCGHKTSPNVEHKLCDKIMAGYGPVKPTLAKYLISFIHLLRLPQIIMDIVGYYFLSNWKYQSTTHTWNVDRLDWRLVSDWLGSYAFSALALRIIYSVTPSELMLYLLGLELLPEWRSFWSVALTGPLH